ncbi:MAG TPA: CoA transferase [Acidimicrobiia bacterium]|nr:CoA transferase [Acidimicrobiia bacterium]
MTSRPPGPDSRGPLVGFRVLDVSGRTGACCTKILADLGADVVKVELPTGDRLRSVPPYRDGATGPEASLVFAYYHHNKRGITLDWERSDAEPLLGELASSADVVVASPRGERERLVGFVADAPALSWAPPGVLTCFVTPFGLTGPYREWRATPFTSFAAGGSMYPVGPVEGPPVAMPGQQLVDEAGVWAAFLVQSVLRSPRAARGQVIDQSVHEVALFNKLVKDLYDVSGRIVTRATNFGPPPGGIWKCRDGWVDVGAHAPQHWDIFLDVVGRPGVLLDPVYRERKVRIELFDVLTEIIAELLATWDARRLVSEAQAAGLPCALMHTPGEFVRDPQARARGYFVPTHREGTGDFEIPGPPFASSPTLVGYQRSAPTLGEANEDVYVDELGHSPEELEKWRSDGFV